MRFVNSANVADKIAIGKGTIGSKPLTCHCFVSVANAGSVAKPPWVLPAVLDSGLGIPMVVQIRLRWM